VSAPLHDTVVHSRDGGAFSTLLAIPERTPAPAIVIVPHILGHNQAMLDAANAYVDRGFIVALPDVFWRVLPGPLPFTDEGRTKARDRGKRADVELCVADLEAVGAMVRELPAFNGRFGVVGYCFGGRYALLAGSRLGASAAAAFHGVGMREYLGEVPAIDAAVSFHFGGADHAVPLDEVTEIQAAFADRPGAEICLYPEAAHNFAIPGMPGYDPAVEATSKARALAVLDPLRA
jgi:carboxymethylenebutenolidase